MLQTVRHPEGKLVSIELHNFHICDAFISTCAGFPSAKILSPLSSSVFKPEDVSEKADSFNANWITPTLTSLLGMNETIYLIISC